VIALIDYGAGNLTSVRKALATLEADVATPASPEALATARGIIVPGVGHFAATSRLDQPWREAIRQSLGQGAALLGICLGMQWLFDGSTESPGLPGLGVFPGLCCHLKESGTQNPAIGPTSLWKTPHVGWNGIHHTGHSALLDGIRDGDEMYFTHSYAAPVVADTVGITTYGQSFTSAVERGRIAGVQFHPEKSGEVGLRLLANWLTALRGSHSAPRTPHSAPRTPHSAPRTSHSAPRTSHSAPRTPHSAPRTSHSAPRTSHSALRTSHSAPRTPHSALSTLAKRIIACLDVRDGLVVKGVSFAGLREAGDPASLAARYNREGIDEIVILDVTATIETRRARAQTIDAVAREIFLPLTVGGGIRTEDDAAAAIDAGADKVSLNTAALADPTLITRLAARYGSQAVIVAIDAKRSNRRFEVYARSGTDQTSRDAVEWAVEAAERGAGELLVTSIDRDGTKAGFDCELTAAVSSAVPIPVIASGGAGEFQHFADVFTRGHADAALAASIFHFQERSVGALKDYLAEHGMPVRRT
jgi:cyclase